MLGERFMLLCGFNVKRGQRLSSVNVNVNVNVSLDAYVDINVESC